MIKLSQKKTCNGCKALNMSHNFCGLGYKYDVNFKPVEQCPKPKTIMEYCECMEWYTKK